VHTIHRIPFDEAVSLVANEARRATPVVGTVRVISIDGPAGAGKSTMAAQLARRLDDAPLVHMDDLYRGWDDALTSKLSATLKDQILTPISLGKQGGYRRWDWIHNLPAESVSIPRHEFLILEGVGSSQRVVRPFASTMVWIGIDATKGLERVLHRDASTVPDQDEFSRRMAAWQGEEILHFQREATFDASHLRFDGSLFT
jgi:Ni2+-binding GTPase involved in maturation of urease and hydrogenase